MVDKFNTQAAYEKHEGHNVGIEAVGYTFLVLALILNGNLY
ncbi:hypothetical protein [Salsuginibacillus kocurii]|nr:hypothetical protein [Salsuginibacillus kocurii]